jgi:hypothetical protein
VVYEMYLQTVTEVAWRSEDVIAKQSSAISISPYIR